MAETVNWKEFVLVKRDGSRVNPDVALRGKHLGLYFSARWCASCRKFTPKLKQFYDAVKEANTFEVVFVSRDNSSEEMKAYIRKSHGDWLLMPFNKDQADALFAKYKRSGGIPNLVIFDEKGERLPIDGSQEVYTWSMHPAPADVVAAWRAKAGTAPIVGGTIDWKEFPLAKRDGTKVLPDGALKGKLVGLYFSARRCQDFGLTQFYETLKKAENFEVVFISDDKSAEEMKANMEETQADWLHIPFNKDQSDALFQKYSQSRRMPDLVLVDSKGNLLSIDGRKDVFQSAPPPKALVATWRTKRTNYYQ